MCAKCRQTGARPRPKRPYWYCRSRCTKACQPPLEIDIRRRDGARSARGDENKIAVFVHCRKEARHVLGPGARGDGLAQARRMFQPIGPDAGKAKGRQFRLLRGIGPGEGGQKDFGGDGFAAFADQADGGKGGALQKTRSEDYSCSCGNR